MKEKEILDGFNALGLSNTFVMPYLSAEHFARTLLPPVEQATIYSTTASSTSDTELTKEDNDA